MIFSLNKERNRNPVHQTVALFIEAFYIMSASQMHKHFCRQAGINKNYKSISDRLAQVG